MSSARCASATRRWRPPTQLKIDFVHHVSYELRSPLTNIIGFAQFLGEPSDRPAHRQAARISRLHHHLDQRAARHHQRHPRSRHHRRRRDDAQSRPGRYPPAPWMPRPRASATAWSRTTSGSTSRAAPTSAASPPTSGASGRCCSICCPTRSASRRRARPSRSSAERRPDAIVFSVTDQRPRHPARGAGPGVRLVRDPSARLAPSRRRPRPVDRALLRRAAWRHGDASNSAVGHRAPP